MSAVAEAMRLHDDGKLMEAVGVLRKARAANPAIPGIHTLQLVQYLTEYVTGTPALPRAEAGKLLDEARALTDDLVRRKEEVRSALMAKSLVLKTRADLVETNPARQKALMAESAQAWEQARYVDAAGAPIAKTIDDLWSDAQRQALTQTPDGKDREDPAVYERFTAAHPDFAPARLALGRYYQRLAEQITDRSPSAEATRKRHLENAATHYRRAADVASTDADGALALAGLIDVLDAGHLKRVDEAETVARSAIARYPDQPLLVAGLLRLVLPTPDVAANDEVRLRARQAVPARPDARYVLGAFLWEVVNRTPDMPRDAARRILADASAALDDAIKLKPEYVEALMYKSLVVRLQATRVEQDAARRKALLAEADRLAERAKALMIRKQ